MHQNDNLRYNLEYDGFHGILYFLRVGNNEPIKITDMAVAVTLD